MKDVLQVFCSVLAAVMVVILIMLVRNHAGDRLTFKDCATKGKATLLGGGTIECKVVKE